MTSLDEDIWKISNNQKAYYLSQFIRLQPIPNALLSGQTVKQFFERSKLDCSELSRIWELSDVSKDGYLSLGEFCVAMHLIVLRLNGIFIPQTLPHSLMNFATANNFTPMHPPEVQVPDLIEFPQTDNITFIEDDNLKNSLNISGSVLNFDDKPALSDEIAHPKAIRANTIFEQNSLHDGPRPPPRLTSITQRTCEVFLPPGLLRNDSGLISIPNLSILYEFHESQLKSLVNAMKADCTKIETENSSLGIELMRVQQQRIVLELLLEHLTPLDENF